MRQYTTQEVDQMGKAAEQLRANGFDIWTQESLQHSVALLDEYFEANPAVPVTLANIYKVVEAQKTSFKWIL